MSSILKALKKVEQEEGKNRECSFDIARDIFKEEPHRNKPFPWNLTVLVASFGFVCILAGFGFWSKGGLWPSAETSGENLLPTVTQLSSNAVEIEKFVPSAKNAEDAMQVFKEEVVAEELIAEKAPASFKEAEEEIIDIEPLPEEIPKQVSEKPILQTPIENTRPLLKTPPPKNTPSRPALPFLTLYEIAYQNDPETNLAVVNGLPVMKGTVIEGARVEEIQKDRVRFSFESNTFEVVLGSSPSPE